MRRFLARVATATTIGALIAAGAMGASASAAAKPTAPAAADAAGVRYDVTVVPAAAGDIVQLNVYDAFGELIGFASLRTWTRTHHQVEVCDYVGPDFSEQIDEADSAGNSTGKLHVYTDHPGGGCFQTDIYYPVRKFRPLYAGDPVPLVGWHLPAAP